MLFRSDWTKQPSFHWNARSSPFFPFLKKTSLQATHFCHFSSVPTKERWANQLCCYIFIPRIFFLRSTDRFSHPILFPFSLRLWFPFDCFLFVSSLMDPGALGVAGGKPTGDSDLQEASTDQRVDHVGGPTHGDEELQETSTGQRVDNVGGRTPQRKLEEQQGPHRAYPRNSDCHLCEAQDRKSVV